MVQELLVIVQDKADLGSLRHLATIEWVSEISNLVIVRAPTDQAEAIRQLPNVISVEPPKIGSVMV